MEKTQNPGKSTHLLHVIGRLLTAGRDVLALSAMAAAQRRMEAAQRPKTSPGRGKQHRLQLAAGRKVAGDPEPMTRQVRRRKERDAARMTFRDQKNAKENRRRLAAMYG